MLPAFGARRLTDLRRVDLQDFADRLLAEGCGPSTIRNALDPLRVIYRRALARDQVAVNPTTGLDLPANRGRRDRIAPPVEGRALLAALPEGDRALWATAMYAGLRRGELRGLRWSDIDLSAGTIRVERSWDPKAGIIEVKTHAGRRTIPIIAELRRELRAHKLRTGRSGRAFVFGTSAVSPCEPSNVRRRALTAWKHAGLKPIGLHECRHTFASLMIAARVETKALSTYLGHASVSITFDRYGHLFPGNEAEAAEQLDAYLARATCGPIVGQ